jgi:hypothetical protein
MITNIRWYNYKTSEHELIETPTDFADYVPQSQSAQSMYRCYLELGETPIEAAIRVLSACVGVQVEALQRDA